MPQEVDTPFGACNEWETLFATRDFAKTGAIVYGTAKLAQRFVQILLTQVGTDVTDQLAGTNFFNGIQSISTGDPVGFNMLAEVAVQDAFRQVVQAEVETDPLDERLVSVDVESVNLRDDTAAVLIKLLTAAGTTNTYLLPVELLKIPNA